MKKNIIFLLLVLFIFSCGVKNAPKNTDTTYSSSSANNDSSTKQ